MYSSKTVQALVRVVDVSANSASIQHCNRNCMVHKSQLVSSVPDYDGSGIRARQNLFFTKRSRDEGHAQKPYGLLHGH